MNRVLADSMTIGKEIPFSPAKNFLDIGSLVNVILNNAYVLGGLLAFIFIILGGFAILSGAGNSDPKQMEQGKQTFTMAIIGLLVIVFAIWIIQAIGIFLGYDPLHPAGI